MKTTDHFPASVALACLLITSRAWILPVFAGNNEASTPTNRPFSNPTTSAASAQTGNNHRASAFPSPGAPEGQQTPAVGGGSTSDDPMEVSGALVWSSLTNSFGSAHRLASDECCEATETQSGLFVWHADVLTKATKLPRPTRSFQFVFGGSLISGGRTGEHRQWPDRDPARLSTVPIGQSPDGPDYEVEPEGLRLFSWSW